MERKVVFLDRDGCINVRRHDDVDDRKNYVLRFNDFDFIPGSKQAISKLLQAGYVVVIVTNQACVGKGYVSKQYVEDIGAMMWQEINPPKGSNCLTFACPHTSKDGCSCRKPRPGLIYAAAFQYGLSLKEAWMVGDTREDMRAGWAACIRKLVLINPEVEELQPSPKSLRVAQPAVVTDLAMAVEYILTTDGT